MTQPEALRIADMLEAGNNGWPSRAAAELDRLYELALDRQGKLYQLEWASSQEKKTAEQAAAELRRLYELAMDQQGKIYALEMARSMEQKTAKLKRDALLEALKEIVDAADGTGWDQLDASFSKARAAIAKAEENA